MPVPPRGNAGAGDAKKPHPVSWLIDELQDTMDRIVPADAPGPSLGSGDDEEPRAQGERDLSDAPHLMQRRPLQHSAWAPPSALSPEGFEPFQDESGEPLDPVSAEDLPAAPPLLPEPQSAAFEVDTPPGADSAGPIVSRTSEDLAFPEPAFTPEPPVTPTVRSADYPSYPLPPPSFPLVRVLITAVVALPLGLIGGIIGARLWGGTRPAATVVTASPPPAPAPVLPSVIPALPDSGPKAETINAILARLVQIADRTEALNTRLEQVETRKPEPPAELAVLSAELGRLGTAVGELAPLPAESRRISERVKNLSTTIQVLRDELAAVRTKAEKVAAPAPAGHDVDRSVLATGAEAPTANTPPDDSWTQIQGGIKLFKKGRFKEALGVFNRLELSNPDDARVWYYAALCLGFATNQWTGGTQQLVEKGLERERAGTPSVSVIEAALSDLTPAQGRDWLTEYRRRGVRSGPASPTPAASENEKP